MGDKSLKERLEAQIYGASPYDLEELRAIAQALQEQADIIRLQAEMSQSAAVPIVFQWADALAPRREKE